VTNRKRETALPVRGVPGGWRDWWNVEDAALRVDAERREARLDADAKRLGRQMRRQRPTRKEVQGRRHRRHASGSVTAEIPQVRTVESEVATAAKHRRRSQGCQTHR
jgi:hypothetical protein